MTKYILRLLFLSRIIDNRSYHDFFGITTFDHKAGKLKEFLKKVGIIFCNRHQFLVFETDNISLKVGITFFSECVKSAILLKNEFSHFAFLNKSSIFNGLSKRLSRLFTAIASLEKFINGRKVTHIITTFFRGNGANTTFLIKSHDTKKVVITFVHTAKDGDRDFSFYRNPGADMMLTKEDVPEKVIQDSKIFHFGTLSMTHDGVREATKKAVCIAEEAGTLISFDPNLRPPLWKSLDDAKEAVHYGLAHCQILKISDNEIQWLTGKEDYSRGG